MNRSIISELSFNKKKEIHEKVSPSSTSNIVFKKYALNSSHASNKSLGAEEVRALLRKEHAKQKNRFKNNTDSRDISHIKDSLKQIELPSLPPLPIEIDHLKKLMESSSSLPSNVAPLSRATCKRENCLDLHLNRMSNLSRGKSHRTVSFGSYETSPINSPTAHDVFEKGIPGVPSGRQEIEHLSK